MAFQKGQSGNPSGRPKTVMPDGRGLTEVARDFTMKALDVLSEIMDDAKAPHSARVSAASTILDRGWGRPKQSLEHTGDDGGPIQFEDLSCKADEFARRIAGLAATGAEGSGTGETVTGDPSGTD